MRKINPRTSDARIDEMMAGADRNQDGAVSFDEFARKVVATPSPPRALAYYVDEEEVQLRKAIARAETGGGGGAPTGLSFISTNDIITSAFGNVLDARMLIMAINLRGRLPGLEDSMAGNYESMVIFDHETYASPCSLRQAMRGKDYTKTHSEPLTGAIEAFSSYGLISNWSTSAKELDFDGCKQTLHLPRVDCSRVANWAFELCIIFKPTRNTHGVFFITRELSQEQLKAALPLGEQIL